MSPLCKAAPEQRSTPQDYAPSLAFITSLSGSWEKAHWYCTADDLKGKRVGVDKEGIGTREIAILLLADNGINQSVASFFPLGGEAAVNALRTGELDAAFFVSSPRAPVIHQALAIPGVRLLSIRRAPAYALQHPFLSVLTLPEGAIDLRLNLPARQTELLRPQPRSLYARGSIRHSPCRC